MISGAAFCPQPPVLVPDVAAGAAPELEPLRAACTAVITRVAAPGREIVVLGVGAASARFAPLSHGSLAGYGVPVEVGHGDGDDPPLSLTIGLWLLRSALGQANGAVGFSVGPDFAGSAPAAELAALVRSRDVALLVMGDGSARRGVKAPGYLDERAAAFDASVQSALATGDGAGLARLDGDLGAELLAAGVPAWQVAGGLLEDHTYDAELLYADDPYGVAYFVAAWTLRE